MLIRRILAALPALMLLVWTGAPWVFAAEDPSPEENSIYETEEVLVSDPSEEDELKDDLSDPLKEGSSEDPPALPAEENSIRGAEEDPPEKSISLTPEEASSEGLSQEDGTLTEPLLCGGMMTVIAPEGTTASGPEATGNSEDPLHLIYIGEAYPENFMFSLLHTAGTPLTAEDLKDFRAYGCDSTWENTISFAVDWDLSEVNTHVPGYYTITGTPDFAGLGSDFTLEDGLADTSLSLGVSVINPDYVDFSAAREEMFRGTVQAEWSYMIRDLTSVQLQYRNGDSEEWHTDENAEDVDTDYRQFRFASLYRAEDRCYAYFYLYELEPETSCTVRFLYDGDQVSNELTLCSAGLVSVSGAGGDRDGGDTEGSDMPDISQEPSQTPDGSHYSDDSNDLHGGGESSSGSSEGEGVSSDDSSGDSTGSFRETVTSDTTVISRERLNILMEKYRTLLISKGSAVVELDGQMLKDIPLRDGSELSVTLVPEGDNQVTLKVLAGDTALTELGASEIRLAWEEEQAVEGLRAVRSGGTGQIPAVYDAASETVRFTADAPGTYTVISPENGADAADAESSVKQTKDFSVPAAAGAGMAGTAGAGAALAFWRWKHHE